MAHIHLFLSCVSAEFKSYRVPLSRDLDRPDLTVKIQENFIATGTETLDKLDDYIRQCDAVIHLVGERTGALAQPPSVAVVRERYPDFALRLPGLAAYLQPGSPALSYTQWEAYLAFYHKKRLIIAAPEPGAPRDTPGPVPSEERAAQKAHLERLAQLERYPEFRFANADLLVKELFRSKLQGLLPPAGPGPSNRAAHVQSLRDTLETHHRIDTRFVRLRLLDMVRSEHALQFQEQTTEYHDLREVLAAIPQPALVLLGAPGCGKTTLLRRLQLDHARDHPDGDELSLFMSLNAFPANATPFDWLQERWARQAPGLPGLDALLAAGRILLLLDALNEMSHRSADDYRARVEQWRDFLADLPPGNRVVFSCRSLDYSETLSVKDGVDVRQVRVQPLTPGQIEEFLRLYTPEQAAAAWAEIEKAPRLLDLYATPYFLRLLCEQLDVGAGVAGERAALFTGFVRSALAREIKAGNPLLVSDVLLAERDRRQLNNRAWRDAHDLPARGPLIPRLQALAFGMQQRGGSDGQQVLLPVDEALQRLDHPAATDLLKAGEQLGLLDEDIHTDQVRFFHQLLQEYFAARQLAAQPETAPGLAASEWRAERVRPSLADTVAGLQDYEPLPPPDPTGWEETAILAAGMTAEPDAFVLGMAETNLPLAGRCAAPLARRLKAETLAQLQTALVTRSRDPAADLRARIAAGRALGELGDPRFEQKHGPYGDYLLPPVVAIPAGSYPIGSDEGLYDDEAPAHTVELAGFAIGQFPVTNAEWRLFMEAGGYADERWWEGEAARRWRREGGAEGTKQSARDFREQCRKPKQIDDWLAAGQITSTQARDWRNWYIEMSDAEFEALLDRSFPGGAQTQPRFWNDPAFNQLAQPVVGIGWHEARAYCAWLTAQTGAGWRLPSEAEWEAAARGRDRHAYPWGKKFDPARCNTFESHIRGTTPVGVFPAGDSPHDIADLAGNVWEWTASLYLPYAAGDGREDADDSEGRRVVRGGSWFNLRDLARCAFRFNFPPDSRYNALGYRVVCVAPIF